MKRTGKCAQLFWTFFRIGLFTFGGGYAMISLIEDEAGRKRGWVTPEDLTRIFAVAESTPGPIAINCATYVGYTQAGALGSACATLGVVLPSFVIIYLISRVLDKFMALTFIANAFRGIQVAVAILILRAGLRLTSGLPEGAYSVVACAAAMAMIFGINLLGWSLSTIWLILLGGVAGIALFRKPRSDDGGEAR